VRKEANDMDIHKSLRTLVQTGRVHFGVRQAMRAIRENRAKAIVVPQNVQDTVLTQLKGSAVPLVRFEGTNFDLGTVCGKPFSVSALTVLDVGESDIMDAVG
jgi:large subunit ribosomal protein L30e